MDNYKKKKLEKAGLTFLGLMESGLDCMESSARSQSRCKNAPDDYKQRSLDVAENLSGIKNLVHDYKKQLSSKDAHQYREDFDEYFADDFKADTDNPLITNLPKCYDNPEKIRWQEENSTKSTLFNDMDIHEWDKKWISLGKLKDITYQNDELKKAGLIRLRIDNRTVYLIRAIEINKGGIAKKLSELYNAGGKKKTKSSINISNNINEILVDIICIGSDNLAIGLCRDLEKALIKKYTPEWM